MPKYYSPSTGGFYDSGLHESMPDDVVEVSEDEYTSLLDGQSHGKRIVANGAGQPTLLDQPAPTQAEVVKRYEAALDRHLDSIAVANRYDNRITFSLRAGYPGPYQVEGVAFAQWMDACYLLSNQIKNSVIAGEREMPSIDDFIAFMPEFVKP